jgi:hypothetical protein
MDRQEVVGLTWRCGIALPVGAEYPIRVSEEDFREDGPGDEAGQ